MDMVDVAANEFASMAHVAANAPIAYVKPILTEKGGL